MNCLVKQSAAWWTGSPSGRRAFTLPEVLIAGSVFLMVVGGVLLGNSFGVQVLGITQPKLAAAGRIRNMISQLYSDVNSAKFIHVGNGDLSSFTEVGTGNSKQGNAIEIYASADTNAFVRYYLDSVDKKLKRMTNGAVGASVVATAISNSAVFTGEDFAGNILTNSQPNMAIGVRLQYYQLEGPSTPVGATNYYKSYSLTNRIAWRARQSDETDIFPKAHEGILAPAGHVPARGWISAHDGGAALE